MESKKVSVIMSCLNTPEEYLKISVESILNQSYKNIEFVIVNNGGNNYKHLLNYQKKDKRIIIINNKKTLDLPSALNIAISYSTGEYIARMDSDDYSLPNRITDQVKYLDSNPNICMCSMFAKLFGAESRYIIYPWNKYNEVKASLFLSNELFHPSIMFRGEFIRKNKLFYDSNYSYSEDYELWNRCADLGNITILPTLGLLYRIHSRSTSNQKSEIQKSSKNKVIMRNMDRLNINEKDRNLFLSLSDNLIIGSIDEYISAINKITYNSDNERFYDLQSLRKFLMIKLFISLLKQNKFSIVILLKKRLLQESHFLDFIIKKLYKTLVCRTQFSLLNRKI